LGVVLVLNPPASALALAVFAVTFVVSRIVSLGSMLAAVSFAGYTLWQLRPAPFSAETWSLAGFSLAIPLLIVIRHRANLVRLLRGEEPRFGQAVRVESRLPRDVSAEIAAERTVEVEEE
jgi:glycerol-3-phosphate acyltransferase PlsY